MSTATHAPQPTKLKRDNKVILTFHILVTLWIHAEQKRMDFLKLHSVLGQCWMPNDADNVLPAAHNHHMAHTGKEKYHVNGGKSSDLENQIPIFENHKTGRFQKVVKPICQNNYYDSLTFKANNKKPN